ncbi:MAG: efflux RND transporter permease subunit [Nevskiaceae bacterium]|jgi:multidrug efflux pump|nr:efflux RND transporter permease subunit [Nevskiaceae bacterium]
MKISELSIRRPVFATVLALLLLIVGLMATMRLSIREYPDISQPVVSVSVSYRGANAAVIESRITQVLENQIAGLEGIDKLSSQSRDESSSINITFTADRNVDDAANDVRDRVSRVARRLPEEADAPQISKVDSSAEPVLYLILTSNKRTALELTDFVDRYLVNRVGAVPGVASVDVNGGRRYAMRIWLDRGAMASRRIAITDIENALRAENVELPAGRIESQQREFSLRADMSLRTEDDFRNLVIGRSSDGYLVRLGEVAQVQMAAENERSGSSTDEGPAIMMPVTPLSTANVLEVASAVKKEMELIRETLPADINIEVNVDNSVFIRESMNKVLKALSETLIIVLVVIMAFLGSLRATLIPAATIPVSIFAAALVMVVLDYSINTVTLLGAVLAIGLVVDDAIVVLENIVRRIETGEPPLLAAIRGSHEIGFAVIATTLVLVAVFLPISYLQGNIGRLFREFGVTVAAAVLFSALIALTLTPMMTSKMFANGMHRGRVAEAIDRGFKAFAAQYISALRWTLQGKRPWLVLGAAGSFATTAILLLMVGWPWGGMKLPQEYAPAEDRGRVQLFVQGPEGSSLPYISRYLEEVGAIAKDEVDRGNAERVIVRTGSYGAGADVSTGMVMIPLVPWGQRTDSAGVIQKRLADRTQNIAGVRVVSRAQGGIGGGGKPVSIVLQGAEYREVASVADRVIREAEKNPGLANIEMDYQERQPQLRVGFDRNKAADLGVSLTDVGRALETMLGSRVVTTFQMGGDEYNVVLQARDEQRATVNDLDNIYVRSTRNGELVPLSSVVKVDETGAPKELRRFNRQRSVSITANLASGYALGDALDYFAQVVREQSLDMGIPVQIDYDGQSRELKRSAGGMMMTFGFALLIVYLVLAAQFESFVHPVVILATVPMALTGALGGLWLFNSSINIFSQIGAVMLIGIASKNGILIVEFSNQLRDQGREFLDAVIEAAGARIRPVLMTTLATAAGAIPLMIATGAGAETRQTIGATVFFGAIFAVALTLFVVPALYFKIARNTKSPEYLSRLIERLARSQKGAPKDEPISNPAG